MRAEEIKIYLKLIWSFSIDCPSDHPASICFYIELEFILLGFFITRFSFIPLAVVYSSG